MFKNIGKKMKVLAQILFWLGIIGCVISLIAIVLLSLWGETSDTVGSSFFKSLMTLCGSFLLYGFATVIETLSSMEAGMKELNAMLKANNRNGGKEADTKENGTDSTGSLRFSVGDAEFTTSLKFPKK